MSFEVNRRIINRGIKQGNYFRQEETLWSRIGELTSNTQFIILTVGLSLLYFIVTGIQFWVTDYLQTVLNIQQSKVFTFYTLTSISAPVLGVIAGGSVTHKYGGYESPNALKIASLASVVALASALPVPFVNSFGLFLVFLWILLFAGGFIVPVVTGIILISVKPSLRTVASSLANLSYNLLGYLPAPFLYGFSVTASGMPRMGMFVLMFATVPACTMMIACTFRRH